MNEDLQQLIRMSRAVGRDPDLVQGGGGNTSAKTADGNMYVKASGTALGDMGEGAGYRLVDARRCAAVLDDPRIGRLPPVQAETRMAQLLLECCVDEGSARPSLETCMHAMLGRRVIHTHPALVGGLLCAADGRRVIEELFGELDPPYLLIEYVNFGHQLAVSIRDGLAEYEAARGRQPEVIFLENHGLIASTDTAERALELTRSVCEKARRAWRDAVGRESARGEAGAQPARQPELVPEISAGLRRSYERILGAPVLVRFSRGPGVEALFARTEPRELADAKPVVPDQALYCKGAPLWMDPPRGVAGVRDAVAGLVDSHAAGPQTPTCLLVSGLGLFAVGTSPGLVESTLTTMQAALQMLAIAACFGGPRSLAEERLEFIRQSGWEAYRHAVAGSPAGQAGRSASDAIAGRVAVVSGAGSGLGRGIYLGLARKGVHVVLADIDLDAARETARRIEDGGAPGSGWPVKADVTDEGSVAALFQHVAAELGGVDILVNCAGIAPTFALIEFPIDQWRRSLEVNLTGYFLMAREAARAMKCQGTGGSIINVSSKTGLEASRNHSAYNATKAGEVHLARGWALELAEHGVRVNTVCPGNVFKESKIWNEDYIRAMAAKRGIRPDEVIRYYVNLTALKVEIDWQDVADAVAFLVSPAASKITGQILVVDAGQVFVR